MKENKKETQLRSAEETLDRYSLEGTPLHIYKEEIVEIMEEYASQFKPSGVKTFTVEDMRAAYNAGMFEESGRFTVGQRQPLTFDEWIKIRE